MRDEVGKQEEEMEDHGTSVSDNGVLINDPN